MFKEYLVFILIPIASTLISNPVVNHHLVATTDEEPIKDVDPVAPNIVMDIPLTRSKRASWPVISYDYIVYLQDNEYDVGDISNPTTYKEVIISPQSNFWIDEMKDDMISMS